MTTALVSILVFVTSMVFSRLVPGKGMGRAVAILVGIAIADLLLLAVTARMNRSDDALGIHELAGHLLAPIVFLAAGLWMGRHPGVSRPWSLAIRCLCLVLLGYFCLSNTFTGYLGPTRVNFEGNPEHGLRFAVLHEWGVPIIISVMLLGWLVRLLMRRTSAD